MDSSLTRRGVPCLHVTEGEALAINAGDLALSLVTGTVVEDETLTAECRLRVLKELVEMTTRTIEGQALDIGWARDDRFDLGVDDYLVMANHKTAFYSGAVPLAVGAIVGGGTRRADRGAPRIRPGHRARVPDPGRRAQPGGHARGHQEGLPQRHHRGQAHARRGARAAALDRRATGCSRSSPRAWRTRRLLEEAVAIMRESGSIDFARDYARDLVLLGEGRS